MVSQKKKRNHFCEICVENRKLIFSYGKYQQIFTKMVLHFFLKNHFCEICVENRKLIFSYGNYQQISQKWFFIFF
jgi:hypothetical protein